MAEDSTQNVQQADDEQQSDDTQTQETKTFDAEYVRKLRSENRDWRLKYTNAAKAETRLKELEDANKTAEQRNADRLAALERDLSTERLDKIRYRVGARLKVPEALIGRLQGDTAEEIEADAKELMAAYGTNANRPPRVPNADQNAEGHGSQRPGDANAWIREQFEKRR